jgi:hypothetical protein
MAALTHLPPEILHAILGYVDPEDLARISVTCRCLSNFISGNNALCRAVYMRIMVQLFNPDTHPWTCS